MLNPKIFVLTRSDIAGAVAHGWNSILLRTGVYQGGEPSYPATTIADDVEKGVLWAIERELTGGAK
jgi:ribonucleotide monophosphatase NagD (HAD superfamily)